MPIEKVLIVDDEPLMRSFLVETLQRKKLDVAFAENGKKGLELIKKSAFDLLISDIRMPELSGIELLKAAKEINPQIIVILTTAYATIENAVEAMRLGAFNYLLKPFAPETIEALIEKAEEQMALIQENDFLRQEISHQSLAKKHHIIAESPIMKKILRDVAKIAKSNASVFISGESGTGKEVIAQAIHFSSGRLNGPFIKVNCAAIPESLIESEFFGHEKGAFTGAIQKRIGRFELADKGTLLLDEISEVPLSVQSKLLRAVQEQEFERVGGTKPLHVDVRFISTSNRQMKEAIDQKLFREDLYYRLNVVPIKLPPLRERKEDILPLASYFLQRLSLENEKAPKQLSADAQKMLTDYSWPGNIRELANVIERAVVMNSSGTLTADELSLDGASCPVKLSPQPTPYKQMTLQELEKQHILETLALCNQNRTRAASALGISIRTLRNKLNTYKT